MRNRNIGLTTLLSFMIPTVAMATLAQASIVYSYIGVTSGSGSAQSVDIYLQEVVDGGSTSLLTSDKGLYNAAFAVAPFGSLPASGAATITGITDQAGASGNFAAGIASSNFTASSARLMEGINGTFGTQGPIGTATTSGGQTTRTVLLGTIAFQAGTQTTAFEVSRYDSFGGNTFTSQSQFDLDLSGAAGAQTYTGTGTAAGTFLIQAVPEPASLGSLASAATCLVLSRRRRRSHRQPTCP